MFGALSIQASGSIVTAASGLTVVETLTYNPNASSAGPWLLTLTDVRVGDQIVVTAIANASSRRTLTFSDAASNAYAKSASSGSTSLGTQINTAVANAATAAASMTVSVASSANAYPSIVVSHLRGATLTLDAANVQVPSMAVPPATVGPFSSSARAFVVWACYSGNTNAGAITDTSTGYTADLSAVTRATGAYVRITHKITTTAVSAESFTASSTAAELYWGVYPFTY